LRVFIALLGSVQAVWLDANHVGHP
jgi:hypothetical protein